MNLDSPRCERCQGQRFLHSRRVLDRTPRGVDADGAALYDWKPRPVATRHDDAGALVAVGRFETLTCRGCGLTRWYAFGWHEAHGRELRVRCNECDDDTPQRHRAAVERANFGNGFAAPPITRGMLGREGHLFLTICRRCDGVTWSGTGYQQLDRTFFVSYKLRKDHKRPCLHCKSPDALIDEEAREFDSAVIPIAVQPQGEHKAEKPIGHFELRLCRPCARVEWYAAEPSRLQPAQEAELFAIGDPVAATPRGPYR